MEMVVQDFFNYMYNGIVNSSAIEIIAFLMIVGGAFGIMIRTGATRSWSDRTDPQSKRSRESC